MKQKILQMMLAVLVCAGAQAQVNSGSNGSDGAFNPTTNTVINMANHPNGIYQYTSVTISNGVTVTFIPNANNSPVTWLVQSNVIINSNGGIDVSGKSQNNGGGGAGGPGGFSGGNGGTFGTSGQGPGAGLLNGGNASYATSGSSGSASGPIYGNQFILPLIGGSGGAGYTNAPYGYGGGGGGGGGAILIAASGQIQLDGYISSYGYDGGGYGGYGSGGSVRLVTSQLTGSGRINAYSASGANGYGNGRIRLDAIDNRFGGFLSGTVSQGFQPVIIPAAGQGVQLSIASVGGIAVPANPSGVIATPDAIIASQQANPISIVVNCANLPLNTPITVTMRPVSGAPVSAVGYNTTGTLASSTATVSLTMPRGGGIIYATAATGN